MFPKIKNYRPYHIINLLILALIIALISGFSSLGFAQCDKELAEAEQRYNNGGFDDAINLITKCLDKPNITADQKKQAYRLLGLTYIAQDYLDDAKAAVRRLLDLIPNYKADTVQDPPTFTNLVEEVRDEMQAEKKPTQITPPVPVKRQHTLQPSQISPLRFGVRGGLNLANTNFDVTDQEEYIPEFDATITIRGDKRMRTTFGFGGFMEYWFSPNVALQFNALYNMKGTKLTGTIDETLTEPSSGITVTLDGKENDIFKFSYLSFPVLAKITFGQNSSIQPYIMAGPEIGILLSAEQKMEVEVTGSAMGFSQTVTFDSTSSIKDDAESIEFGANFGGGVTIPLGNVQIFIDGMYGLGLSKLNKEGDKNYKNSVIYINIGLIFGGQ